LKIPIRDGFRRGVAGVLLAVVVFALLFSVGLGLELYQSQGTQSSYEANLTAIGLKETQNQETLTLGASLVGAKIMVTVNDTGPFPISVVSTFVENSTRKLITLSSSGGSKGPMLLSPGSNCFQTAPSGPMNLPVGAWGRFNISSGAGSCFPNFSPTSLYYVAIVTSRGNVFTVQFPFQYTTVVSSATSFTTSTTSVPGSGGGNSLVVVMSAMPVQAFSGDTVTDTVDLYNYSPNPLTLSSGSLSPNPPTPSYTGTATLAAIGSPTCSNPPYSSNGQPDTSYTIPGYGGSGAAPYVYYLCTYKAQTGAVGGLASFSGGASATQGSNTIVSSIATSNLIQIGGLVNTQAQGAFSSNFFFLGYTSCYISSAGGGFSSPCSKSPSSIPPSAVTLLPKGYTISGGHNQYVAFYVQITNNLGVTLPILQYTFEQLDSSCSYNCNTRGGISESDWWVVGNNGTSSNGVWSSNVYYPNYPSSGTPTLQAYPKDCSSVRSSATTGHPVNSPTDGACIYVNPGQTVTITLAACGAASASWDWGGTPYGTNYDNGNSGCPSGRGGSQFTPSINQNGMGTAGFTVISFWYNGQTYTETLAYQGVAFTP
jgi:hypothetical protein